MLSPIRSLLAAPLVVLLAACGAATPAGKDSAEGPAPAAGTLASSSSGAAPQARDWSQTVMATAEGGFRMGNPEAKVKLVEYASLTCGVCQRFHLEGVDALKSGFVRSGRVSYEFRPFMLNAIDIAGTLVARCDGPERFFTWAEQFYRNHDAFVQPFTKISDADIKTLNGLPQDQQVRRLAELGGLDAFVRTRG
ncbi:thioredoxin domain-containing protein, partial [Thermaurantiacus sp.]